MKFRKALSAGRWRPAVLAVVLTGALGGTALAAVSAITLDPTAQLSPGALHATLTGTVTCDPGDTATLQGQIVADKNQAGGIGTATAVCDGTPQPYAVDVSSVSGFPFPGTTSGPFKAGKATAQVSSTICEFPTFTCTTKYADGQIKLVR